MSKNLFPILVFTLLVLAILGVYVCTFQVDFYEKAVKVRLGKATDESIITEPGLHFKWPPPIEHVKEYDTRLQVLDTPETEIKTGDGKAVIVGSYAVWRIENPLQFYKRVRTVQEAEKQMRDRLSTAQAGTIGQRSLSDFVSLDREQLEASYETLLTDMLKKRVVDETGKQQPSLKDGLLSDYGIAVERIGIRRISLPQSVTQQVFNAMREERNRLATKYQEEGNSRAAAIMARAEADARQIQHFADSKAQEIRSSGIEASAEILAKIKKTDQELFEWLRWLDALKVTLKNRTTIFIDSKSPLYEPFVNPPATAEESR